jgi:surfactin synthase thioesterase subunit
MYFRTVTGHNQELVVLVDIVYLDIREGSDYLLLGRKIGALLELEVAYRARQGKVAVDAAEVNKAACCLDTCLLG